MTQPITDADGFRLVSYDPDLGRTVWSKVEDGQRVFRIDQRVDQILDANNEAEVESQGKRIGDWSRVASVPVNLAHNNGLMEAMDQKDDKWVAKFLNDADNKKFRTRGGTV